MKEIVNLIPKETEETLWSIWRSCISGPIEDYIEWISNLYLKNNLKKEINFWKIGYVEGEIERILNELINAKTRKKAIQIIEKEELYHQTIEGYLVIPYDDPEGQTSKIRIKYLS